MRAFEFIKIPKRPKKPRGVGLTFIIDKGLDMERIEHQISLAGDIIDLVKFGFGTARIYPKHLLKNKIAMLRNANIKVCPGGTFFEIAYMQNVVTEYFKECQRLNFDCIEISDGTIPIPAKIKLDLIKSAQKYGFTILTEVGRKDVNEDKLMGIDRRIVEINEQIDAGAWKVILEARESGNVGIYANDTSLKEDDIDYLLSRINFNKLIFEAPHKHQQVSLIKKLGNEVNLGNILLHDVYSLETLRLGLRADTALMHNPTCAHI